MGSTSAAPRCPSSATWRPRRGPAAAPRAARHAASGRWRGSSRGTNGITSGCSPSATGSDRAKRGPERDPIEGGEVPHEYQVAAVGGHRREVLPSVLRVDSRGEGHGSFPRAAAMSAHPEIRGLAAALARHPRRYLQQDDLPSGVGPPPHTCRSSRQRIHRSAGSYAGGRRTARSRDSWWYPNPGMSVGSRVARHGRTTAATGRRRSAWPRSRDRRLPSAVGRVSAAHSPALGFASGVPRHAAIGGEGEPPAIGRAGRVEVGVLAAQVHPLRGRPTRSWRRDTKIR